MAALASTACAFAAQAPAPRIQSEISSSEMSTLKGSLHPQAQLQFDAGRMSSATQLHGMTIVFNRSAAQEAALQSLLAAQQDPSSPLYHKWLTPEQFAARFGMSQADLQNVQRWLQQQGFSIDTVARSRTFIKFSGNVNQVENAFQTQMHYFNVQGARHFAPATELSVPTAIAPTVAAITNLSDFRPHSQHIPRRSFTSGQTGNNFFAPGDINTAYDMKPLLTAGNNGTGQTIVVAGQSYISVSDIENFESAAGLTKKDPNLILVPGSGDGTTTSPGDEGESDLDLEWSSAMAPGATIDFVYAGSDQSYSVFDAVQFAVDTKLGEIISISYGVCETELGSNQAALEAIVQQGATQGQTIIAASGDEGSTACFVSPTTTNPTLATQEALAVNYPASSQYVTGVGGTEISSADETSSTYWDAETPGTDIISSLKGYIPEIAWNDEAYLISQGSAGLSASGGGASALFAKPSWQTGVAGIPTDSKRDVPDVSFYSSPSFAGYLYCTSDQSDWAQGQTGSCGSGFRASSSDTSLTIAGGTSFATPIFAGMLADLNQKAGETTGQGNINPMLYQLASTHASAFHDVTSGNNECLAGTTYCSSSSGAETKYSATTGYDLVTGLGSVDLDALANAWTASTSTAVGTTTTVSASSTSPALNASDTFTVTVTPVSGTTPPAGTLTVIVDDGTPVTGIALTASGSSSVGTYQTSFATSGGHSVVADFVPTSANAFAASSGGITVTVPGSSSGKGSITVTGTNVTVNQGSSGTSTVTVTPAGGYTGTVYLTIDTSNDSALQNLCYAFTNTLNNGDGSVTVSGTAAVTTQLTFDTNASDCVSAAIAKGGKGAMHHLAPIKSSKNSPPAGPSPAPMGIALGGLLLAGFLGRYARKFRAVAGVIALLAIGLAISACGGGGSSNGGGGGTVSDPPKGTYTITLKGTDSVTTSITNTSTFSLKIQ
ncbi:MAG TPA: protease pro-enzyme activation domain-containing protein [Terracidiphilus sp.]|nr:protease pro-enzyme activation domain-containing protein [Terracidiphilus sp.]